MGATKRSGTAFATWLDRRKLSAAQAAEFFGVSRSTIHGWRQGTRWPTMKRAKLIQLLTKGAVPVASWPI